jgi:hypothetical protein
MRHLFNEAKHVDRASKLTKEEFDRKYGFRSQPVLITDMIDNWPAKNKWNNEYFKKNFSGISDMAVRPGNEKDKRQFSISDYMTYMEENKDHHPYYFKNAKFHLDTDMVNDYTVPDYFRSYLDVLGKDVPRAFQLSWMYIGATGTYSSLHLDIFNTSAWNAVFSGRKIWAFYSPDQAPYLYKGEVNLFAPNLESYPNFAKAKPLICVQNPGEVVFTPSGWWHAVYNEVGGISLTENFVNDTNYEAVKATLEFMGRYEELKVVDGCKQKFQNNHSTYMLI